MAELKLNEASAADPAVSHSHPGLALVREATAFLVVADPELASSLSIVIRPDCCSASDLAAVAERIAEEYGLHMVVKTVGDSLVVVIARATVAPLAQ
jgi:hypothetical protein